MIEGVVFDVGGTLVDSVDLHARAWVETFAHFGQDTSLTRCARKSEREATSSCLSF